VPPPLVAPFSADSPLPTPAHSSIPPPLLFSPQGFAEVTFLQLRSVSFQRSYEQTITDIQLQEQLRVTKSYQQEVTRVLTDIDILQSETEAQVVEINADAARQRDVIIGQANAEALKREQGVKSTMYKRIRDHLGWTAPQFLQYVKMKALNTQPQSKVIVGVNGVGNVPP
jgi:regulator of protease activity HflC (stomatin/prohibitin superfamily)